MKIFANASLEKYIRQSIREDIEANGKWEADADGLYGVDLVSFDGMPNVKYIWVRIESGRLNPRPRIEIVRQQLYSR